MRLYNGIELPEAWPPRYAQSSMVTPQPVPYLKAPPRHICIDIGRQLFVDDFLIEQTDMRREYHRAEYVQDGPVFFPQTELEMNGGFAPMACPFNDGIVYDPEDRLFKMWYHAGFFDGTAYAQSEDGIHWTRLSELRPGSDGRVIPARPGWQRDGASVWLDHDETDRTKRFKMFVFYREYQEKDRFYYAMKSRTQTGEHPVLYASENGMDWREMGETGPCGDNTDFFYNPFRKKYCFSIRKNTPVDPRVRARYYYENEDFYSAHWDEEEPVFWDRCSLQDEADPALGHPPQLYNLDAVAYESLMLGAYHIFLGPPNGVCRQTRRPKIMDVKFGFSRDGFHFDRSDNLPFLTSSRVTGRWDYGYLHTHSGLLTVVGDRLYFHFSAWSGVSPVLGMDMYAGGSVGLGTMRRDGFASMEAGETPCSLTTRALVTPHPYLFVNADCPQGELAVEVLDEAGRVVEPFTRENCRAVHADSCRQRITWAGAEHVGSLGGKPFRLRFTMSRGALYAFWLSPTERGNSLGYMGAGGPGFSGGRDL